MVNKAQCKPGHTPTITQLAISRARGRNQTQVYWPQSTMLSQTWKLREQGVSLCLCDDQPNTREYSSCACPMWPPALWAWQATEQPLSWLHDFPVSGKTSGQGPASSLLLSYFLYNSVFKQLALTAPADLSPQETMFWPVLVDSWPGLTNCLQEDRCFTSFLPALSSFNLPVPWGSGMLPAMPTGLFSTSLPKAWFPLWVKTQKAASYQNL